MGALRIKESVDQLLDKDPYELFSLDRPATSHGWLRRLTPETFGAAALGVLAAFAVAGATFWSLRNAKPEAGEAPFAYFEIKAIGPDGRPVAGAVVKEGATALGVTDSFGEWRRFMRVRPGTTMLLSLAKQADAGDAATLAAVKNIAVPMAMPKTGDLELTGSVQLNALGRDGLPLAAVKATPAPEAAQPVEAKTTADELAERQVQADTLVVENSAATSAPPAPSAPLASSNTASAAAETTTAGAQPAAGAAAVAPATAAELASIWFMAEPGAGSALTDLDAALRRRAHELGLKVEPTSPWRVSLHEIVLPGGGGRLLRVAGFAESGTHLSPVFTFLRAYGDDTASTAREILAEVGLHAVKHYQVTQRGGAWYVANDPAKLWALGAGRTLYSDAGRPYRVAAAGPDLWKLDVSGDEPCGGAPSCAVATAGVALRPPLAGWQALPLKVVGGGDDTEIYVSGYAARRVGDHRYEYWGAPGGGANVTALRGARLIFRGRIQAGGAGVPQITVPSSAVSRPAPRAKAARKW